ncbi:MAG: ribonuclease P protein component [Myxococcota bacterium]
MTSGLFQSVEESGRFHSRQLHQAVPHIDAVMLLPGDALPQCRFDTIGRLRKRFEFVCVQRRGVRCCAKSLIFIAKKCRDHTQGRIGFTAPKKIGPAHVRNRVKRRLRHLASYYQQAFVGCDVVILALPCAAQRSFCQLHDDFRLGNQLLQRKIKRVKRR